MIFEMVFSFGFWFGNNWLSVGYSSSSFIMGILFFIMADRNGNTQSFDLRHHIDIKIVVQG